MDGLCGVAITSDHSRICGPIEGHIQSNFVLASEMHRLPIFQDEYTYAAVVDILEADEIQPRCRVINVANLLVHGLASWVGIASILSVEVGGGFDF